MTNIANTTPSPFASLIRGRMPDLTAEQMEINDQLLAAQREPERSEPLAPTDLSPVKHLAKLIARDSQGLTHTKALECIARALHFSTWYEMDTVCASQTTPPFDKRINAVRFLSPATRTWNVDASPLLELDQKLAKLTSLDETTIQNFLLTASKCIDSKDWNTFALEMLQNFNYADSRAIELAENLALRKVPGAAYLSWTLSEKGGVIELEKLTQWAHSHEPESAEAYLHLANHYQTLAENLLKKKRREVTGQVSDLMNLVMRHLQSTLISAVGSIDMKAQANTWLGDIYANPAFQHLDVLQAMKHYIAGAMDMGQFNEVLFARHTYSRGTPVCSKTGHWDDWELFGKMLSDNPDEQTRLIEMMGNFVASAPQDDEGMRDAHQPESWDHMDLWIYQIAPNHRLEFMQLFHENLAHQARMKHLSQR